MSAEDLSRFCCQNRACTRFGQRNAGNLLVVGRIDQGEVLADVTVENLAGHRFPSSVGFRRAFVEFNVFQESNGRDRLLWASGRTNELGVIVDGAGKPLPSEFFERSPDGVQQYQPHYSRARPVRDQGQV